MNRIKMLLMAAALTLVLAACQGADISMETPEAGNDAGATSQKVDEVQEPSTQESGEEAVNASEEESEDTAQADSSEEVAKFPVRDEKIPPYELDLIDGTSIKLDQFEGQVVIMTFFTTW